jgi:hypothetical protein
MRPIATEDRYQKLLAVADAVEPLGRFRCVLALARECGRRINAIVNLRASDVLLSPEQMVTALAAIGRRSSGPITGRTARSACARSTTRWAMRP